MTTSTKTCPKCGSEHIKPGTYCSRACANSRQWTDEHKKIFSIRQREYMAREDSEEHRAKRSLQVHILRNAGIMGNKQRIDDYEDLLTNPDDYYLVPFNNEDLKSEDGDYWEEV